MGDDDDVLFTEPFGVVEHFPVVFQHQPFVRVGAREGLVEPASVFTHGDPQGSEALLPCTVKNLEGGMRGNNAHGDGIFVVAFQPFLHRGLRYAHMEWFRTRSMSIMSAQVVDDASNDPRGTTRC